MNTIVGVDLGHRDTIEAEHWLADQPPVPGLVACTHLVHGSRPRVVLTLYGPVDRLPAPDRGEAALAAVAAHCARRGGRAVRYPGVENLVGTLTVAELLARSAIQHLHRLGDTSEVPPDTLVDTRDFVRPQWMDGRLTLVVTAAPGGRIAPFEVPNPTPCCGGHR